ncbi:ribonuclease H-like domain-containing protein [Tanacetum coccineum]|uniref:Ribonuclease H-like domain-containing protein n=1 Tax=Tanacetum coccineum TaxID=301880 RepID=A0ABQ4WBS0_9ASTR
MNNACAQRWSTWMPFGGNTRDLGSLARKRMRITELAQATKKDRDKIRALEKERDDLQLNVSEQRKQVLELQTAPTSLKRKLNANEDKYLDDVLNLEAKLKKNENVVIKMSNSVQALFMIVPKPLSVYEPQLKHGLGFKVHVNVCDTEEILENATKSQIKMENKLKDPIAIEKKQIFRPIGYRKLNDLYATFVLQVELSAKQKYFSSVSMTFEIPSSASTSSSPPVTMPSSISSASTLVSTGRRISIIYTQTSKMAEQDTPPPTITSMKIHIIKKGEYDIWSMRMRQYICHTNYNLWDIIVDGDLQEEPAPTGDKSGPSALPVPKTAKQLAAKRNQERVKSILLLAIPDEYLLKFHNVPDAKSLWAAIKSRFGGNEESKKMQKNVLKHQFENFTTASNESLDKAYDRFQKLISQLEVHGAPVSKEDINQNFLRSLPHSWSQIALIMRNKPYIDQVDIDDLYNNLRVYEDEMKRSSSSTSNSQKLAFHSSKNTSSTNEVSTASGNFGATSPPLDNKDLQQIDQDDLEELDIRQQVAMLTVRVQRFVKKTGRNLDFKEKQPITFDKSKVECYNCHRKGHFAKECKSGRNQGKRSNDDNGRRNATTNEPSSQALVAQDGLGGYDWSNDFDEPVNYALMAISSSSSSSSSDNEVQNCSKQCLESFKTLQKNYDSEREKHKRARLEIQGYELALESLESRILGHEKNELAWGEKYEFQNYELKCRELKINNLNMELEKVVKERDELNIKIAKWEESSKSLNILLNSQMSAHDKNGLGYGTQLNEMSDKSETDSEISMSVFEVRSSDEESTPVNDRFSKVDGYHVVPPPITGNFLTPRADISFAGLDEYAIRKKIIESKTDTINLKLVRL